MRCLNCRKDGISIAMEVCPKCGVHLPTALRDVLPPGTLLHDTGDHTSRYRVDYALGRGGFGITYRGAHTALQKIVAIKEYYPQEHAMRETSSTRLSALPAHGDAYEQGLERFQREGRILAGISHPNIVRVHDLFAERGTAYLVMELVAGTTLREELDTQPGRRLPAERVREITGALVAALEELHAASVFHLDIKPDNILITSDGRVVLIDFGAARQGLGSEATQAFTAEYAPPEVLAGTKIGPASDLFELGMVVNEMLTGECPPSALGRLLKDEWKPSLPADLKVPWQALLTEALHLRPEDRPRYVRSWWSGAKWTPSSRRNSTRKATNSSPWNTGRAASYAALSVTAVASMATLLWAGTHQQARDRQVAVSPPAYDSRSHPSPSASVSASAYGRLQATSNCHYATLYYRNEKDRAWKSADCSPDSELLSLPPGRYRVRIEARATRRIITRERILLIRPGETAPPVGPD